jgi:HAD superfamily hydrolase (TIGR01509 family)
MSNVLANLNNQSLASPLLVIFDCDGVLVDSEPIANQIFVQLLTEEGLSITYEEAIQKFIGLSKNAITELIENEFGTALKESFFHELRGRTFAAFETDLQPIKGIKEALDQIIHPKCVASSGDYIKIKKTLELTKLFSLFEPNIFSATEVEKGKPAPDLFLFAAERMGIEPENCCVIEDSIYGVQAGVAAGMKVLGYAKARNSEIFLQAGATLVFDNMNELPKLLKVPPSAPQI